MNYTPTDRKHASSSISHISESTEKEMNITDEIIEEMQNYPRSYQINAPLNTFSDSEPENILFEYKNMKESFKNFTGSCHSVNEFSTNEAQTSSHETNYDKTEVQDFMQGVENFYKSYREDGRGKIVIPKKRRIEKLRLIEKGGSSHDRDFFSNNGMRSYETEDGDMSASDNAILNEYITTYVIEEVEGEDEVSQLKEIFDDYLDRKMLLRNLLDVMKAARNVYVMRTVLRLKRGNFILRKQKLPFVLRCVVEPKRLNSLASCLRMFQARAGRRRRSVSRDSRRMTPSSLKNTLKKGLASLEKRRTDNSLAEDNVGIKSFLAETTPFRETSQVKIKRMSSNLKGSHVKIKPSEFNPNPEATPCFKLVLKNDDSSSYIDPHREGLKSHRHPINSITKQTRDISSGRRSLHSSTKRIKKKEIFANHFKNSSQRDHYIRRYYNEKMITDISNDHSYLSKLNKSKSKSRGKRPKSFGCDNKNMIKDYKREVKDKGKMFRKRSSKKVNDILRPKRHFMSNLNKSYRYRSQKSIKGGTSGRQHGKQTKRNRRKSNGLYGKKRNLSYFDGNLKKHEQRHTLNFDHVKEEKSDVLNSNLGCLTERYSKKSRFDKIRSQEDLGGNQAHKNFQKFLDSNVGSNQIFVDNMKERVQKSSYVKQETRKGKFNKSHIGSSVMHGNNSSSIITDYSLKENLQRKTPLKLLKNYQNQGQNKEVSGSTVTEEDFKMTIPPYKSDGVAGGDSSFLKKGSKAVVNSRILNKFKLSLKSAYAQKEALAKKRSLFS